MSSWEELHDALVKVKEAHPEMYPVVSSGGAMFGSDVQYTGQNSCGDTYNLAVMAEWMDIPEKRLYRDFRKMYGVSFTSYLEMKRTQYAQEMLKENRPIGEVAQAVGYSSDYSFRRAFKRVVGVTPSDYQRMQENNR